MKISFRKFRNSIGINVELSLKELNYLVLILKLTLSLANMLNSFDFY